MRQHPPRDNQRSALCVGLLAVFLTAVGIGCAVRVRSRVTTDEAPAPTPRVADSTLRRLRASLPSGIVPNDTAAVVIGVVAGGRASTLLSSAQVALFPRAGGVPTAALTDERGQFVLGPVAPGSYQVRVRRIGYMAVMHAVDLRAGGVDTLCVNLAEQPVSLTGDCPGACTLTPDDSAFYGRPNVRCS